MEGLTLGLSGTIHDAKYTDWVDDTPQSRAGRGVW